MKNKFFAIVFVLLLIPNIAIAGDAATLIFNSGHRVYIDNGFTKVTQAMKELNSKSQDHKIVEFELRGGSFILNVAEVVVVCKDQCPGMEYKDAREETKSAQR
jgi:hypothetical protein